MSESGGLRMRAVGLIAPLVVACAVKADPVGCPRFEVETPRSGGATVVRAADFGFSPTNDDNAAAINRALFACKRSNASRLELEGGTYRCFGTRGLRLEGLRDFTLDAKGARLVFRRPVRDWDGSKPQFSVSTDDCSVSVSGCRRIEIRGLSLDWDWKTMPLGAYARVVGTHLDGQTNGQSYVDYELIDYSESNPHPYFGKPVPLFVCNPMSADRFGFREGRGGWCNGHGEGLYGARNQWLSPCRLRVWPCVKDPAQKYDAAYDGCFGDRSNRKVVESQEIGLLYRLVHYYYGKNAFVLDGNEHLTLRDCSVESSFGMGVVVCGGQRYWQLVNFRFGQDDSAEFKYPVTTTADACHVVESRGWCKFVNCRWSKNLDDTNNFHDRTTLAVKASANVLRIANRRGNAYFQAQPGTEVELFEENYAATGWRARIESVDGDSLRVDREIPDAVWSSFVVRLADRGTDNVLFSRCDFTDGCMRNLIQGSQVTIEDCVFRRESGSPLRLMAEWTEDRWCEGVRATNVVVRGCLFDSNQIHDWAVDGVVSEIFSGVRPAAGAWRPIGMAASALCPEAISDILVENCTFRNPKGAVWHVVSGTNLVFRNNRIACERRSPKDPPYRGKILCPVPGAMTETGNSYPTDVPDYSRYFSQDVLNQSASVDTNANLAPMLDVGTTVPNGGIFRFFPCEYWTCGNVPRFAHVFSESPYRSQSGLRAQRFDWSSLEREEGEYLFDEVVEPILRRCILLHERMAVGLACNTGATGTALKFQGRALAVPPYLYRRMEAEGHPMRADDSYSPGWTPDYDAPSLLARHRALLQAFAQWLKGTVAGTAVCRRDLVHHVEMRYLGYWGEGGLPMRFYPTSDVLDRFADAYVEAFPDILLVAGGQETLHLPSRRDYESNPERGVRAIVMRHFRHLLDIANRAGPVGFFIDSWHPYSQQYDAVSTRVLFDASGRVVPLFDVMRSEVYGRRYLTGEFGYLADVPGLDPYSGLYQQFSERGLCGISVHNFTVLARKAVDGKSVFAPVEIPQKVYDNACRCLSMLGYRLVLGSPRVVSSGERVRASFTLTNIGVGRIFHDYNRIHLVARDSRGKVLEDRRLDFDLRTLAPASEPLLWREQEGHAFREEFPAHAAEVFIRIPDESGIEHPLTLSNYGRRADGSYLLGRADCR